MSAPANLDWLFTTLGYTLAAAGVLLLLWSLFWDRAKGRRRCPKCWYDMAGVPTLTCPECGRAARTERKLLKTRRRWRWAGVALIIAIAADLTLSIRRFQREGLLGTLPTSALILIAPVGDRIWESNHGSDWGVLNPPQSSLLARAIERLKVESVWHWQSQVFLGRVFLAHPGEIEHTFQIPKAWPTGVALRLTLNPLYASRYCRAEPQARVRLLEGSRWTTSRTDEGGLNIRDYASVGMPAPAASSAFIEAELVDEGFVRWRGLLPRAVPIRGTLRDYLAAAPSPAVDKLIKEMHPRVFLARNGEAALLMNDPGTLNSRDIDRTLALTVDILRDGETVGQSFMYFPNLSGVMSRMFSPVALTPVTWSRPGQAVARDDARWEMRLRQDESLAMQDYRSSEALGQWYAAETFNRYWSGDLLLPLITCGPDTDPLGPRE